MSDSSAHFSESEEYSDDSNKNTSRERYMCQRTLLGDKYMRKVGRCELLRILGNNTPIAILCSMSDEEQWRMIALSIQHADWPELRAAYKQFWCPDSLSAFVKIYKCNRGNFSRWLRGLKRSCAAPNAITKYLLQLNDSWLQELGGTLPAFETYTDMWTFTDMIDVSPILCERDNLSCVVFIDVANTGNTRPLHRYIVAENLSQELHVVSCRSMQCRRKMTGSVFVPYQREWVTRVAASSESKDAVDANIIAMAILAHTSLDASTSFLIVSRDGIFDELCAMIRDCSERSIKRIPTLCDLIMHLSTCAT